MNDSRLTRVTALLDDAREILVDIVDEGPTEDRTLRDFNQIDAARIFINGAIVHVQSADSTHPGGQ